MAQYGFSEDHYYVRKASTGLLFVDNAPASAGECRDTVNNLSHLSDESGQVWACDGLRSGVYVTPDVVPPTMTAPAHLARVTCYSVRTRPSSSDVTSSGTADGGPYKLRVRIGGATNGVAGTATFYVIAGPADSPTSGRAYARAYAISGGGALLGSETSATSTTATEAWLTATTTILTVPASMLTACRRTVPTYGYDAADAVMATTADVYTIVVDVFGFATTNAVAPRLHGLYVAEYIG